VIHLVARVLESCSNVFFFFQKEKIIAQLPFARTVRDISMTFSGVNKAGDPKLTWHIDALNALHEAAETYVVELFEDAALCAEHGKRHTLYPEDMQLAQLVRGASSNK
jgi:histone H3/H4